MNAKKDQQELKRVIGVRAMAANAVNLTVGAGIFALPALVAIQLGAASFLAYLVCIVLLGLILLCFADVGSKITTTGGVYAYIEEAFGPWAGFLANTLFWLGFAVMADAAVANVLADNLVIFFPALQEPAYRSLLMLFVFGSIAWVNVRGTRESSVFVSVITIVKLTPLLLLIGVGAWYIEADNFTIHEWPAVSQLGDGALLLFFAFGGGVEATLNASGEIKDPSKTIPSGLLAGAFMVFCIYLAIQLVAQGVLGDQLPVNIEAPLAAVAQQIIGPSGTIVMVFAAAFSCFALISGDILVTSRLPYAAARDKLLPSFLARVHPRFQTPYRSVLMYASIGFIASVSGGFRQLAILSSASILVLYIGVAAASIKLRKYKPDGAFHLPGGVTVPVLALLVTAWFLIHLEGKELVACGIFILIFTLIYWLNRFRQSR